MNARGFTLIEVIIALFIITIGAGAAFVLLQRTLAFSSKASFQLRASYLAQEGVELVRNIRDSNFLNIHKGAGGNWDDGLTSCSSGCEADYNDSALGAYQDRFLKQGSSFYTYDSGVDTAFKRKITVISVSPNRIDVTVEVSWSERGRSDFITASTQLYNWLNPAP